MGRGADITVEQWQQVDSLLSVPEMSVRKIAKMTNIPRRTIRAYIDRGCQPAKKRPGRNKKLSPAIIKQLTESAATADYSVRELQELYQLDVSPGTIIRALRSSEHLQYVKMSAPT